MREEAAAHTGGDADMPLRVIALGGVGEFGNNLTIYEYGDEAILIDCGTMFPETATLGIDLVIPDMSYIFAAPAKFKGLFLTHAHEDHVGATPFLLQRVSMPVFGLPLTIGFIRDKLDEFENRDADLRVIRSREIVELGSFRVEPIHVTHSTVDSVAYAITTPAGTIIHTGDFKLDGTPVNDRLTDIDRLVEYGNRGVLLLVSDSTNVLVGGHCPSEQAVGPTLERLVEAAPGRVLITTFSSHIHRMQQVLDIAKRTERDAQVVGRSMIRNVATAERLGYLRRSRRSFGRSEPAADRSIVLITGSQGEPRSALARAAVNENTRLQLIPGDTVLFSARIVPGREVPISRVIDNLYRRGAEVHAHEVPNIHSSGHAYVDELKSMIELTRPRYFIPVHGTLQFLMHHAALAKGCGIPDECVVVITNGIAAEVGRSGARKVETVNHGKVHIDSESEEIHEFVVRDRRHLAYDGFLIVIAALNTRGVLMRSVEIITRGVLHVDANAHVIETLRRLVTGVIEESPIEKRLDRDALQDEIRSTLKRYFRKSYGRRPLILPVVWEM